MTEPNVLPFPLVGEVMPEPADPIAEAAATPEAAEASAACKSPANQALLRRLRRIREIQQLAENAATPEDRELFKGEISEVLAEHDGLSPE